MEYNGLRALAVAIQMGPSRKSQETTDSPSRQRSTSPDRSRSTSVAPADESTTSESTRILEQLLPEFSSHIRLASFWIAILLPFVYLPLLARGLTTLTETSILVAFLTVNLLALYVGHPHAN